MILKVEAIIPKNLRLDAKRMNRAIENALDLRAADVKVDFQVTTDTWERKPAFVIAAKPGERRIYTSNKIYKFVSGGTRPHPIAARNGKALAFYRTGFRPKTRPGYIGSNKGQSANKDLTIVKRIVRHPGTRARDFDRTIQKKWQKIFPRMMQDAINYEATLP